MTETSLHKPTTMESLIRELDRRVRNLETAPRLTNSSIQDGSLRVLDADRDPQVIVGKQDDGSFGLVVLGPNGVLQRVGGVGYSYTPGTLTYSATTWGTSPADQDITVNVGPSGLALVTMSALIFPGSYSLGESAFVGVIVDGAGPDPNAILYSVQPASSALGGTASFSYVISGLADGAHTFRLVYAVTTAGVVATFKARSLVVQPL